MPTASCRGRLERKGSYHLKARKAGWMGCTCALAFFIAHPRRGQRRTNRCRTFTRPDKYVTVFLPPYRFFRSGGTPVRLLRAMRSPCPYGFCRTSLGAVMRSWRSTEVADRTPLPAYRSASPWVPLSFRHTVLHGVSVFFAVYHTCGHRRWAGTELRIFPFRAVRGVSPQAPPPFMFHHPVSHREPVLPAVYHTCTLGWREDAVRRASGFPRGRFPTRPVGLSFGEQRGARRHS